MATTREQKLEIVSAWLNRHSEELADELKVIQDPDSPLWLDLEEQILDTFEEAQTKSIEIFVKLRNHS